MSKNDIVNEVIKYLATMTPILQNCGIQVDKYQQDFSDRPIPQLKEGLAWLKQRFDLTEEYRKIRALVREEVWEQYKHMDTEDFREVLLLNAAIDRIRKSFIGRPALFRRKKDACKCKRSKVSTPTD